MSEDLWFERLADLTADPPPHRAPPRLTSRVYSAVVTEMAESGPLLDLSTTRQAGAQLCVFENLLAISPSATGMASMNPCRVCHARVLGERLEHAPIYWPGCPYSDFHRS
jgi:hypothetical protein